jgi:hypothetical protein
MFFCCHDKNDQTTDYKILQYNDYCDENNNHVFYNL